VQHLTEKERAIVGGSYNGTPINAYSMRTYTDQFGRSYMLARDLELNHRPFRAFGPFASDYKGYIPPFKIAGEQCFSAKSWKTAEKSFDEAVGAHNDLLKERDLIVAFDEDGDGKQVLIDGLSGVRVELWFISQEVIDRGLWGDEASAAGWYWQRMVSTEIHGPYGSMPKALENYFDHFTNPLEAKSSSLPTP